MPCGIRPSNVRVCHFTTRAAWGKSESGTQESKQTDQLQKGRSQNKSGKQEPRKASKRTSFTKAQNQNKSGKQEPRKVSKRPSFKKAESQNTNQERRNPGKQANGPASQRHKTRINQESRNPGDFYGERDSTLRSQSYPCCNGREATA